jgi:hypothetical protein
MRPIRPLFVFSCSISIVKDYALTSRRPSPHYATQWQAEVNLRLQVGRTVVLSPKRNEGAYLAIVGTLSISGISMNKL